jgi:hypothetical protein
MAPVTLSKLPKKYSSPSHINQTYQHCTPPIGRLAEVQLAEVHEDVTTQMKGNLREFLEDYADVFSFSDADLGRTSIAQHRIDTRGARPVRQPLRRQPMPYLRVIDENIDSMLVNGLIEPACSE